ncbi:hypothetical protein QFC19_002655 [Naganishia cerealis]|uniref:Uncharacterized protein n=1 Tax=Naganishia cerealis TaxID=610337 RepID=A0ACC2WBF0_9TREE|nr:hypothetical protein QFC19_002655 [Naganishia cerealis]
MARSSNTLAPQVTTCPYTVNKRYLHVESGLPLTVRYIGPLPPFSTVNSDKSSEATIWIGVEWDDPQRGKHSGTYRDLQVFHTRVPGAASFLKFKPRRRHAQTSTAVQHGSLHGEEEMQLLDSGIGLFQAVYQRYISSGDATAHEMPVSKIVLGSSNGQILVEMPNIDKVVQRLRRGLEPPLRNQTSQNGGEPTCLGIKEIGLEDEWVYGVEEDLDDHQADSRHLRKSNQWTTLRGRLTSMVFVTTDTVPLFDTLPS